MKRSDKGFLLIVVAAFIAFLCLHYAAIRWLENLLQS